MLLQDGRNNEIWSAAQSCVKSVMKWLAKHTRKMNVKGLSSVEEIQKWRLLDTYPGLPQQPNQIDCALYVYKYMEQMSAMG